MKQDILDIQDITSSVLGMPSTGAALPVLPVAQHQAVGLGTKTPVYTISLVLSN